MRYFAYFFVFMFQVGCIINRETHSKKNYQDKIEELFYLNNNKSLTEALKMSRDNLNIINMINNEFYEITHFLDLSKILLSLKNGKSQIQILIDIINHSKKVKYNEGVVKGYTMMGYLSFQSGQYNKAINYYKCSIDNFNNINNIALYAFILQNLAIIYYDIGDFHQSLMYCQKSLEIGIKNSNKQIILSSYQYIANNYTAICDYEKALECSFKAIDICDNLKDKQTLASIMQNIGIIYSEIKNYDQSLLYTFESLKINQELGSKINIALSLSSLGIIYSKKFDYYSALYYLNKSLKLNQEIMFHQGIATVYDNIGNIYRELGNKSLSMNFYKMALNITQQLNDLWNIANISNHIGKLYIKEMEFEKAQLYLEKSLYYSKKVKATDILQECYKSCTDLYASIGKYKDAYQYLKLYSDFNDSTMMKNSTIISDMMMKYEIKKREQEYKSFQLEYLLELDKQKTTSGQLFIGSSVLLSLLLFSYLKYNEKNKMNKDLNKQIIESIEKQTQQKQIILHQASLTTLGEYSVAIAHEVKQPLQMLFLDIESLSLFFKEQNINIDKVNILIEALIDNMNRIKFITEYVKNLSCRQKEFLKEYFDMNIMVKNTLGIVKRHYEKKNIKIIMIFEKPIIIIHGSPFKLEQVLLNLLSNASDAIEEKSDQYLIGYYKSITIKCYIVSQYAILSIEDNGIGIKPEIMDLVLNPFYTTKKFGKGLGLGLSVVKEVIDDMNGLIEIESTYLEGTNIKLKIPIQKEPNGVINE